MFVPVSKYYNLSRTLLLISGLWPYQKSKFRYIQAMFFLTVLLSFIVLQFTTFIGTDCSINLIAKVLSIVLPIFVCIIKHSSFFFNSEKMRHLMDLMWYHWTIVHDKHEIGILEKHTKFTKQFTIFLLHFFGLFLLIITVGHMMPVILDIIVPLNSSRPRHVYVIVEYFIDQERYFLLILLHTVVTLSVAVLMISSVGSMLMAYVQHACAMLKISSYRIGDAATVNFIQASPSQKDQEIYKRIINGIHIHQKAIEFTDSIFFDLKVSYFILLSTGVASIALSMFQVFIAFSTNNINELITAFLFLIIQFCYMFLANYMGQIITDHFVEVFSATYHSYWYRAPLRTQRLVLFIMQRTSKNFSFIFGGIFIASLKGFSTLASMSISYFTVISSMIYSR